MSHGKSERVNSGKFFMHRVLQLAKRGRGRVSPNPLVGAVIVKGGEIIGEGYHRRAGTEHAEIIAIKKAGTKAKGATMYVNLEPCCHYGKTPPCTTAIIESGIKEVFIGTKDPNPLVSGKGISILEKKGIKVFNDTLKNDARRLNEYYFTFMEKKRPYIIVKIAQTIDGRIADTERNSKWITNEDARKRVHSLRNEVDAILTGIGTVLADDPRLTPRLVKKIKEPKKIVLDPQLKIPLGAHIVREGTIVVTQPKVKARKKSTLSKKGVVLWEFPLQTKGFDLKRILRRAHQENIQSILIEGGNRVITSFMKQKLVDKIYLFIANKILGTGLPSFSNLGVQHLKDSIKLRDLSIRRIKNNLLITGYVYWNH
jgi:diaminohydroxyphosphoribosylaminopyrimidine deaminase/5-amino-6-(5-phosphoribosylamino)uracil reductase